MAETMQLYHVSYAEIREPDIHYGRKNASCPFCVLKQRACKKSRRLRLSCIKYSFGNRSRSVLTQRY